MIEKNAIVKIDLLEEIEELSNKKFYVPSMWDNEDISRLEKAIWKMKRLMIIYYNKKGE